MAGAVYDIHTETDVLAAGRVDCMCMYSTWDAVVACGFLNFVLYAASAVMAFLEWRASKKGEAQPSSLQLAALGRAEQGVDFAVFGNPAHQHTAEAQWCQPHVALLSPACWPALCF